MHHQRPQQGDALQDEEQGDDQIDDRGTDKVEDNDDVDARATVIAKRVPGNKYESTLDCLDGYHGIELAEEDRHKTTFATEWGKF